MRSPDRRVDGYWRDRCVVNRQFDARDVNSDSNGIKYLRGDSNQGYENRMVRNDYDNRGPRIGGLHPESSQAYRFAIDYRKLNAITTYSRYLLPLKEDLIANVPHTRVMSTLDLRSGYFQSAVNSRDISKTAFT
ncbi:hypothetical protein TNCV_753161 [Trichonephila clavipes]|uniref:Reverse transcriptase n=1 Tax=Trichonephila clavipes TaxID=2585209 RepID=A0A8X6WAE6_TRICX|nr:hypothetical protein TNCV_753161 [Trichonephila clavipes]